MTEKCPHCNTKVKSSEQQVNCPSCGTLYHYGCWKYFTEKCVVCGKDNDDFLDEKIQSYKKAVDEKEQNNTEVKSNQEDCVNHESTNQPKTNISVQHEHSKKNIVSGVVFIIFGIIILLFDTGYYGGYAKFGGDFYTEIYQEVAHMVSNIANLAKILKFGFGFLFIGLGVDRLTKK